MTKHGENKFGENNFHAETEEMSVEEISKIDAQNIDVANYFMTLTTEAAAADILSEREIADMQSQISDILADLIWQYNSGSSTSVTTDIASDLIESVVFALDLFCIYTVRLDNSVLGNDRCVEILKEKAGIKSCYAKGLEYVAQVANHSPTLYNELLANKLHIGIPSYNSTINKSLAVFFKNYDARFFPHKTKVAAPFDYSLALSEEINKYKGILYVNEYLRYLLLENEFCALFDAQDVQRLIKIYANSNGFLVSDLMENIFEKVFANILFSMLADLNNAGLFIERGQYDKIAENFYDNGISKDEIFIGGLIYEYTEKLIINFKISNPELQKYLFKHQQKFAKSILPAVQRDYLHNRVIFTD